MDNLLNLKYLISQLHFLDILFFLYSILGAFPGSLLHNWLAKRISFHSRYISNDEEKTPNSCYSLMFLLSLRNGHASMQEVKPSVQPIPSTHQSSDCIIIDAEDCKPTDDHDVQMFVQHTESMLEEIDRMVFISVSFGSWLSVECNFYIVYFIQDAEVEMEDLDENEDIDSCDKKNPLAVTDYIDDIYAYYKRTEVKLSLHCLR